MGLVSELLMQPLQICIQIGFKCFDRDPVRSACPSIGTNTLPRKSSGSRVSIPCPPESGPSASDLRASDSRTVSLERDVRVFHIGNFPSSRSFLICLDRSRLEPFTNVLPRI